MRWRRLILISMLLVAGAILAKTGYGMNINEPRTEYLYTHSVIGINFTDNLTGAKTCYYTFNAQDNTTIKDCHNLSVEFPINEGHINLTLYERNDSHTETDRVEVRIDNDFNEGKAIIGIGLLALFLILPFVFWYPCFKLDYLHTPVKLFLTLLGFFCCALFFYLGQSLSESYLHNPAVLGFFSSISAGYIWVFYSIVAYFLITFLFNMFEGIVGRAKK